MYVIHQWLRGPLALRKGVTTNTTTKHTGADASKRGERNSSCNVTAAGLHVPPAECPLLPRLAGPSKLGTWRTQIIHTMNVHLAAPGRQAGRRAGRPTGSPTQAGSERSARQASGVQALEFVAAVQIDVAEDVPRVQANGRRVSQSQTGNQTKQANNMNIQWPSPPTDRKDRGRKQHMRSMICLLYTSPSPRDRG